MPSMITPEFKRAYERLNPEQKRAVEAIDGPVMVVAGPGTGKTEVLTLRIANILLKTDTSPENILALTFTESGATNMRKRLASIVGQPAYRVRIQTFHGFCNDILHSYPEYFPRIVGAVPIADVEATSIIEGIIKEEKLELLRPWGEPMLYVGDIIRKIEELKREGLDPIKFKEILKKASKDFSNRTDLKHEKGAYKGKIKKEHLDFAKKLAKNMELALIYEAYQKKLEEKRLYDWSDMIMEVLGALKNEKFKDLKMTLQEEHQYILVDEHQDTNDAQNQILELLSDFHQNPNIFVVGDHKQAIFRFQGASVENFLYFKKLYKNATLIDLFRNYRSTQSILDSAHSVINSEVKLLAHSEIRENKIKIGGFKTALLERLWLAEEVRGQEGTVAIIYRSNKEAFPIANALTKKGVSFVIDSDEDLLGDKYVKKFLVILEAVHHYDDDLYLTPLLHLEMDQLEIFKLVRAAKTKKKSLYELLPGELAKRIEKWAKDCKDKDLPEMLECLFKESGLMEKMLQSRDPNAFLGISRIFDEAERLNSRKSIALGDFVNYLDTLRTHGLFIKKPKSNSSNTNVRLMTAHRAKGLEFDTVFIVNASEKSFGSKSDRDKLPLILNLSDSGDSDDRDDERRLFYVALTRAKSKIYITYHENNEEGREILPSEFLAEIKPELKEEIGTREFELMVSQNPEMMFAGSEKVVRQIDKEFVSEIFYNEQLSVTALNNYLECPWKYFYRNLLRIPERRQKHLLFGTAMHAAVEDFFKTRLKRETGKEYLLESFERHMSETSLEEAELRESIKRGRESLAVWYDERSNAWLLPYKNEQNIFGVEFESVRLSGKLDKVEFAGESEVFVTDYKTGKARSRNDIEGKTRESNGNLKRQLVFYKLLLDLYRDGAWNMTKGIIEFLEPNESGKIKWEEFIIEKSEVEDLKDVLRQVITEITTLSFWDKFCDDKSCEYCSFRKLLEK
jgi:DNA helicase II / ATP-dependent DNA helicase PcrA